MCGENLTSDRAGVFVIGSSPRVRGKLAGGVVGVQYSGLIPACAGKTASTRHTRLSYRAHPRVCGENIRAGREGLGKGGSSPRVRGKLTDTGQETGDRGLIPACAGKTKATF